MIFFFRKNNEHSKPYHAIALLFFVLLAASFFMAEKLLVWEGETKNSLFQPFIQDYLQAVTDFKADIASALGLKEKKTSPSPNDNAFPGRGEEQISPREEFLASIKPPYNFLIVGDSLILEGFGPALEKDLLAFDQTTVKRTGHYSTGLSRPDYFDWNQEMQKLIAENKSNVVIVLFGPNDAQGLTTKEGKIFAYGIDEWNEEYLQRVKSLEEILASNKILVLWLGVPIAKSGFAAKMENLNSIYEEGAASYNNVFYISTWSFLTDSKDQYNAYLPDAKGVLRLARAKDGIHVTNFGGQLLANAVLKEIGKKITLTVKSEKSKTAQ